MSDSANTSTSSDKKKDGPPPHSGRGGARGGGFVPRGRGGPFRGRGGPGGPGGHRGGGGGRGGGMNMGNRGPMNRGNDSMMRRDFVQEKLQGIQGPTHDLPPLDMTEKKFSGRARLYIGNLTPDTTDEQLKELMSQYGEVGEVFFNTEKHFAFLRLSSRAEAERAKRELDGQMRNGRALKVRFAPHQGAIKVSNLGPWVTNELLHKSFSVFGDIERCHVLVDERGRSKHEGVVEFERKSSASEAIKRCSDGCFFLTSSLRPVVVELMEENDDEDGLQEKMLPKRNLDYQKERETGPRFAAPGSFEFEYGQKWKALHEMKRQKMEALEREMTLEEDKLVAQMEYTRYEHETEQLRNQLRMREANREQQKNHWEERERHMSEMMREEQERRQEQEQRMNNRIQQNDDNMRQRRQENSLFMQAQELNNMLDEQEAQIQGGRPGPGFAGPGPMGNQGGLMGPGPNMGPGPKGGFNGGNFGGNFGPPNQGNFGPRGGGNFRGGRGDFGGGPIKRRRF